MQLLATIHNDFYISVDKARACRPAFFGWAVYRMAHEEHRGDEHVRDYTHAGLARDREAAMRWLRGESVEVVEVWHIKSEAGHEWLEERPASGLGD